MGKTLMRASGMTDEQIERHEALVGAGYLVTSDNRWKNDRLDIVRGPFPSRDAAWRAAEEHHDARTHRVTR